MLNSVKTFGNIVCFRNLETATNNALSLVGDKKARGMVILKTYNEYMNEMCIRDRVYCLFEKGF